MQIKIKKCSPQAVLPVYASDGAAGADLFACCSEKVMIPSGETRLIPTGLSLEIPEGYAGLIFARSGLATKQGLAPANKVGVIDADYRGEVLVSLHNHSNEPRTIEPGMRVAQLVIMPVVRASFLQMEELAETERGAGGFGSTGS